MKLKGIFNRDKARDMPWTSGVLKTDEDVYEHVAQIVDGVTGQLMLSVKQARITSVVFGALAAISLGGFVYQSQQSHVLPIAVTFDQAGKAGQVFLPAGYVPTYQNKQSFMVQWISYAFSWTTSQSVNTERRTFLAASTADAANKDYIAWFNASLTDTERLVKIDSIKPTADKDVLAVEWQELRSTPAGKQLYHYIGDFTIKVHKVDEVADIYANPYQLAVVHYTKVPVNG